MASDAPAATTVAKVFLNQYRSEKSGDIYYPYFDKHRFGAPSGFETRDASEFVDARTAVSTDFELDIRRTKSEQGELQGLRNKSYKANGHVRTWRATFERRHYLSLNGHLITGFDNGDYRLLQGEYVDLDPADFTLPASMPINDYCNYVVEQAENHSQESVLNAARAALSTGQTAGSRWFRGLPLFIQRYVTRDINTYLKYLLNQRLFVGYHHFLANTEWSDDDFEEGRIELPGSGDDYKVERWCDTDIDAAANITNSAQGDTLKHFGIDVATTDRGLTEEEKDSWFASALADERFPARTYGLPSFYGTVPEEAPRKVTKDNPKGIWAIAQAGDRAQQIPKSIKDKEYDDDRMTKVVNSLGQHIHAGRSLAYSCIILHDTRPATFYREYTIDRIANDPDAVLSTVFRVHAHPHRAAYFTIEYLALLRDIQIPFMTARIPLTCLEEPVEATGVKPKGLRKYFRDIGLPSRQTHSASRLAFTARTLEITLHHDRLAQADMSRAGFPDFASIVQHVSGKYAEETLPFEVFIPSAWKDFEFWATILPSLQTQALDDPLMEIRAGLTNGYVVESKNINLNLASNTVQLDKLMRFDSVEEQITILSDGISRELYYQQMMAEQFSGQQLEVILRPVGRTKVEVPDPRDKTGAKLLEVLYVYHATVVKAPDMKRLRDSMPPPGTPITCQVDISTATTHQPVHERTKDERCDIIGKQIFNALVEAQNRPTIRYEAPEKGSKEFDEAQGTLKERIEEHRANMQFANACLHISPFVRSHPKTDDMSEEELIALQDDTIRRLAKRFERQDETDDKGRTLREPLRKWRQRIIKGCASVLHVLELPPLVQSTTPTWTGIRYDVDGPLKKLGDMHFLLRLPKQPNWDKKNGPAPFIYPNIPSLPEDTGDPDRYVNNLLKVKTKISAKAVFQFFPDERTAKERLKGLKKLSDLKAQKWVEWLATLRGPPTTANLFTMVPLLERIRHQLTRAELPFEDDADLDTLIPDNHLIYDLEIRDEFGNVNPITTREYQVKQNILLKNFVGIARTFDNDQLETFFSLSKAPFGSVWIQGVPGSGKSRVAEFIAAVIQNSELCPMSTLERHLSHPQEPVETVLASRVKLMPREHPEGIVWTKAQLPESTMPPNYKQDSEDSEDEDTDESCSEPDDLSDEPRIVTVSEDISIPPLMDGPSGIEIREIIDNHINDSDRDSFLDDVLVEIRSRFQALLEEDLKLWVSKIFLPAFGKAFCKSNRMTRACAYRELLNENRSRAHERRMRYYHQWESRVRQAFVQHSSEDRDDMGVPSCAPAIIATAIPPSGSGWNDDCPDGETVDLIRANNEFALEDGEPVQQNSDIKAPKVVLGGKVLIIVQRNEHGERVAESFQRLSARANPLAPRTIIKVNNLILEEKELVRSLRGIDPRILTDDFTFSVADQLNMALGMEDATDFGASQGRYTRKLTGGIYTLNAMVRAILDEGKYSTLAKLLEEECRPGGSTNPGRTKEIAKQLDEVYRDILKGTDVVVCTPVVASKLADKKLYEPAVTIFDEAGMMPEADSILVMQQFDDCRHFLFAGDRYQGGVITLSDELQLRQDTAMKAYSRRKDDEPRIRTADYRLQADLKAFTTPFVPQFQTSLLERMDKATPYVCHTNTNHRQQGGLHRVPNVTGYEGRMESSFDVNDMTPVVEDIHRFLNENIAGRNYEDIARRISGTRLTIWHEGDHQKWGTSWTNPSQINLAVHLASRLHTSGLVNEDGNLLSILIATPYAQATRDARRAVAALSPWEICHQRIDVRTIDGAQGNEYDFTITAYIVGPKGGFLWKAERPIVAQTRPRLGAIDILPKELCEKKQTAWQHFKVYAEMQDGFNATITDQRNWSKLSKWTYMPASEDQKYRELFCPNCTMPGHHPRNCPAAPGQGLLPNASNVSKQIEPAQKLLNLGRMFKNMSTVQTRNAEADDAATEFQKKFLEEHKDFNLEDVSNDLTDVIARIAPGEPIHEYGADRRSDQEQEDDREDDLPRDIITEAPDEDQQPSNDEEEAEENQDADSENELHVTNVNSYRKSGRMNAIKAYSQRRHVAWDEDSAQEQEQIKEAAKEEKKKSKRDQKRAEKRKDIIECTYDGESEASDILTEDENEDGNTAQPDNTWGAPSTETANTWGASSADAANTWSAPSVDAADIAPSTETANIWGASSADATNTWGAPSATTGDTPGATAFDAPTPWETPIEDNQAPDHDVPTEAACTWGTTNEAPNVNSWDASAADTSDEPAADSSKPDADDTQDDDNEDRDTAAQAWDFNF